MATLLLDGFLALLAAFGLLAAVWLAVENWCFAPERTNGETFAVIEGRGAGEDLEYRLSSLFWLEQSGRWRGSIVLLDCGLDEQGREIARRLAQRNDRVSLCSREELADHLNLIEKKP